MRPTHRQGARTSRPVRRASHPLDALVGLVDDNQLGLVAQGRRDDGDWSADGDRPGLRASQLTSLAGTRRQV
jgi:hypothetical protein